MRRKGAGSYVLARRGACAYPSIIAYSKGVSRMRLSKLLLVVVGATVFLGALVSSASARNLSTSAQSSTVLWRSLRFSGGFGTVECEIKASGSFHSRTIAKVVALVGYITEASVLRCATGGATINQASLPWHRRYRGFTGTLPNITGESETISGVEWTIREPVFGVTCTARREATSLIGTFTLSAGAVTRADVSGTNTCGGAEGTLTGGETNALDRTGGARLTITLI
jgi:hypothetical protein